MLFVIAEQLRELALFRKEYDAGAYLDIAETLQQIAECEAKLRVVAENVETLSPWRIKKVLNLRFAKSAELLHYLSVRPDQLHHQEVLLAKLGATLNSLRAYACDIRKSLAVFGLRGEFVTVSRQGYLATTHLAERVSALCVDTPQEDMSLDASDDQDLTAHSHAFRASLADRLGRGANPPKAVNVYSLKFDENTSELTFAFSNTKSIRIILILASRKESYVSAEELVSQIESSKGSLKVLIHRIRNMFRSLGYENAITSSHGKGYSMSAEAAQHALASVGHLVGKSKGQVERDWQS